MIDKHGMPPIMEYHQLGIENEVTILQQEIQETIHQKMQASSKDGMLNLQLLGLKEIPKQILKMKQNLKKLKFDFNLQFQLVNDFPKELMYLHLLSFKGCKMLTIPENIHIFEYLTTLNLEDNRLEYLPEGITELTTLTNISKSFH
jgi:Leucine-rich repeat (LRR) protein